jgi:hypothetical protein
MFLFTLFLKIKTRYNASCLYFHFLHSMDLLFPSRTIYIIDFNYFLNRTALNQSSKPYDFNGTSKPYGFNETSKPYDLSHKSKSFYYN